MVSVFGVIMKREMLGRAVNYSLSYYILNGLVKLHGFCFRSNILTDEILFQFFNLFSALG